MRLVRQALLDPRRFLRIWHPGSQVNRARQRVEPSWLEKVNVRIDQARYHLLPLASIRQSTFDGSLRGGIRCCRPLIL